MYKPIDSFIKRSSLLLLSLFGLFTAYSQNLEQIHLKDGSVIEGYICEQIPGKRVTVQGCKATITVGADSLISSSESIIPVGSLSTEWKSWLMEQNVTPDAIKLSTLKFPNTEYADVRILENGDVIKFLSLSPKQYLINWSSIDKTSKVIRSSNQFSGLNDILILKGGTRYEGQVREQIPGKSVRLSLADGSEVTVNASLIDQMQTVALTDKIPLEEQSPLLDRIFVKGIQWPIEGLIIHRKMNKDLTIETLGGKTVNYPIKSILKYQKFINPKFRVLTENPLPKGKILLNDSERNAWFTKLEEINGYNILGKYSSMVISLGEDIVLKANINPTTDIKLIKAYNKAITDSDGNSTSAIVFTHNDLQEISLPGIKETTQDGYLRYHYTPQEAGDYVMRVAGIDGYIIITVD